MRLRSCGFFLILFALCGTACAQASLAGGPAIAGPWECQDAKGIHGFFVSVQWAMGNTAINWQNESIRVYERLNTGEMHNGYFSIGHSDSGGSTFFDGKRLRIELSRRLDPPHLPPFSLDAVLDAGNTRWTGKWSLCEPPGGALFERPKPRPDVLVSGLVGNWERQPDPTRPNSTGEILHILQSADGTKSAFQETLPAHVIQELSFTSPAANTVVLRTINSRTHRFEGILSAEGSILSGRWIDEGGTGVFAIDDTGRIIMPPDIPAVYKRR